jgi:hypothetical protein
MLSRKEEMGAPSQKKIGFLACNERERESERERGREEKVAEKFVEERHDIARDVKTTAMGAKM